MSLATEEDVKTAVDESSDSSSDSDSDEESVPQPDTGTGAVLTLQDDEETGLLQFVPPEDTDLGPEEDEGEGDEIITPVVETPQVKEEEKPKKKKKKKKRYIYCCLTSCKYESVRRVSKRFGFKEVGDEEEWNLFWTDYSVSLERVMEMKKYQKINHFPGMSEICRKDLLARNMNRMLKLFPKEYNVFPKSWCLPADYGDFQAYTRAKKHKTYILKPESGCQGKGIWVTKNPKDIKPHEHMLCQQYISKPFLIDGFKFDLRIYTLVTSCDPLRIFVFRDGLARFATHKYTEPSNNNVSNVYMHLTNYSINKGSSGFIRDDEAGSKRRIITINKWLRENNYDVDKMWDDIDDCIVKTLISAHSILKHNYRTCFPNHVRGSACFEILGFDVMLDKKLKPLVLEVNHSPSFHTDAKLDKEIKEALLFDTLNLVNFGAVDKRKCIEEEKRKIKERLFQRQNKKESKEDFDRAQAKWIEELDKYEESHLGNFRRIYPNPGAEKYDKYFQNSGSLYQETAAFKARSEAARQQREEILRKKEKLESLLKKKKNDVRPESPGSRRRKVKRLPLSTRRNEPYQSIVTAQEPKYDQYEPIDTTKPMDIQEEEELERISSLLQRDNLVRGLGIVEHVYRLLHCTPGTMGIQLKNDKFSTEAPQLPSRQKGLSDAEKLRANHAYLSNLWKQEHSHEKLEQNQPNLVPLNSQRVKNSGRAGSSRYSDSYITSEENVSEPKHVLPEKHVLRNTCEETVYAKVQFNDDISSRSYGGLHDNGTFNNYSYNNNNQLYNNNQTITRTLYHQGLLNTQGRDPVGQYRRNGPNLGQLNERVLPHRTRYTTRKGNFKNGVSENEYRELANLLDSQKNQTVYGRHGYEVRTDSASSARRTLSASPSQRGKPDMGGNKITPRQLGQAPSVQPTTVPSNILNQYSLPNMVKVTPQASAPGLSVVSAPAPIGQRPDLPGSAGPHGRTQIQAVEKLSGLRSTKSQNNYKGGGPRNHAVVYS